MPRSCHGGRTPLALALRTPDVTGAFAGQRNTSILAASRPFDHDHEQPLPTAWPADVADAEPTAVDMDRLLTADELAERLGMKTEWVWAQARAGRIPHVRLGRYRRFRESAVEEWLRELETGGAGRPSSPPARPIPLRRRA
jgi:excisionase family DNA binding protein